MKYAYKQSKPGRATAPHTACIPAFAVAASLSAAVMAAERLGRLDMGFILLSEALSGSIAPFIAPTTGHNTPAPDGDVAACTTETMFSNGSIKNDCAQLTAQKLLVLQ